MGYEIHIEREKENKITFEEWNNYVEKSSDFKEIESQQIYVWEVDGLKIPFTFSEQYGWVSVKNPNDFILKKMVEISKVLKGSIVGEEGEGYDEKFSFEEFG